MASNQESASTQRDQRVNLSVLGATAFLRGAHTSAYNVVWQPFVLSLGASMPTLGLLSSLGGMNGIVTTLVQPLGGWLADRLGRKPFLILAGVAYIAGYALFWLSGALNIWSLLLLGVIAIGVSALANPARSSITAESVRERHGSAFSAILVASMAPGIIVPALAGLLADHAGYISVFPIALALEVIGVWLVWRYLRETRSSDGQGISPRETLRVLVRSIVPTKGLAGFFCAVAADSFFWGVGWGLLYGMLTDAYHFSAGDLGIMSGVMSLSWAVMQMPIGRYIDRRNIKTMMIVSEAIGIPLMLIWITQTRFEFFAASQILFALTAATWVPTISTYLTRAVSPSERAEAFGRLYLFRGIVSFPSSTIGGFLYAWGGLRAPLIVNMLGILVVMTILALFVCEPPRNLEAAP
ncbi:MAG TPA: MFS transporter [Anaerolineae bacterium]